MGEFLDIRTRSELPKSPEKDNPNQGKSPIFLKGKGKNNKMLSRKKHWSKKGNPKSIRAKKGEGPCRLEVEGFYEVGRTKYGKSGNPSMRKEKVVLLESWRRYD